MAKTWHVQYKRAWGTMGIGSEWKTLGDPFQNKKEAREWVLATYCKGTHFNGETEVKKEGSVLLIGEIGTPYFRIIPYKMWMDYDEYEKVVLEATSTPGMNRIVCPARIIRPLKSRKSEG